MKAEKRLEARLRIRLTKEMAEEVRRLAEVGFRTFEGEMRFLLSLGIEEEKREAKHKALRGTK